MVLVCIMHSREIDLVHHCIWECLTQDAFEERAVLVLSGRWFASNVDATMV